MRTKTGMPKNAFIPNRAVTTKRLVQSAPTDQPTDDHDTLTENQWNAIVSLLEGRTLQATADRCGVNVRTLRRWIHSPDFAAEYARARREHFETVTASLQSVANEAAETLTRLLRCGDPLIELRAARAILQIAQKSVEEAEDRKKLAEVEKTNTVQEAQIKNLLVANNSLQQSKEEFSTLSHSLIAGTFKRPDWISVSAWDNIIHANPPNRP